MVNERPLSREKITTIIKAFHIFRRDIFIDADMS